MAASLPSLAPAALGHPCPAQNSLQEISNKARRVKNYRFRNLYRMLNENLLRRAFYDLNKRSSPGVDKETFKEYESNLDENLKSLTKRLKEKKYKTRLIKRVFIPKGNGKQRPLGLPSLEDKIVQMGAGMILMSIF